VNVRLKKKMREKYETKEVKENGEEYCETAEEGEETV
jgi:hypothetical protein